MLKIQNISPNIYNLDDLLSHDPDHDSDTFKPVNKMNSVQKQRQLHVMNRFSAFWPARSFFILRSQGAFPQAFTSFGRVYRPAPEVPLIRECRRGRGHFGNCRMRVGYGPAPGPTIKKALCHTCPFGGAGNKYRFSVFWLRSKCSICSHQLNTRDERSYSKYILITLHIWRTMTWSYTHSRQWTKRLKVRTFILNCYEKTCKNQLLIVLRHL